MRVTYISLLAATGALLGCGGPPPDETRLVLLDEQARIAGALVQLEHWEGSPAFPIRLTPGERPLLITPTDAQRLDVPARMIVLVEGAEARVRVLELERDLSRDTLLLTGSEGAARQVAGLLDADMTPVEGGYFQLTATELLDRSAFLEAPRGLREVQPLESPPSSLQFLRNRSPGPPMARMWTTRAETVPIALVGVYAGDETMLVLDAEGGFSLTHGCGEPERGTAVFDRDQSTLTLVNDHRQPQVMKLLEDDQFDVGNGAIVSPIRGEQP